MALRNSETSYGCIAKYFHWLMAILLIGMLIFGFFLDDIPKEYKGLAFTIHKLTGLFILFLAVLRLIWTTINLKPSLPLDILPWQRFFERFIHYSLYVLIIVMPLAGFLGAVAGGRPPRLGPIVFSLPINKSENVSSLAFFFHDKIAILLIIFISIHVLAAFYHHFIKADDVLRRMV